MRITEEVRVEATEDIRNYSPGTSAERNGNLIAKKGRQGWIYEYHANMLLKTYPYDYIDVTFDGNKIRRHVPNKSLKLVDV